MAEYNTAPASTALPTRADAHRVTAFLRNVYAWMCAGLGVTASLTGFMVNANSIGKATLTGMYGRGK